MNRLTTTIKLPSDGTFIACSDEEYREINRTVRKVSLKEIYCRLQEYENTGLTPEEILVLRAEKDKRDKALAESEALMWDSRYKPCPNCGSTHISTVFKRKRRGDGTCYNYYYGYCHSCGNKGNSAKLPNKALEAWNNESEDKK